MSETPAGHGLDAPATHPVPARGTDDPADDAGLIVWWLLHMYGLVAVDRV